MLSCISYLLKSTSIRRLMYAKEVCGHFDMCIFTLNWLTLTPKTHFVQFYLKVASYFLSWGKNKQK